MSNINENFRYIVVHVADVTEEKTMFVREAATKKLFTHTLLYTVAYDEFLFLGRTDGSQPMVDLEAFLRSVESVGGQHEFLLKYQYKKLRNKWQRETVLLVKKVGSAVNVYWE
jgi:hypothetical protein